MELYCVALVLLLTFTYSISLLLLSQLNFVFARHKPRFSQLAPKWVLEENCTTKLNWSWSFEGADAQPIEKRRNKKTDRQTKWDVSKLKRWPQLFCTRREDENFLGRPIFCLPPPPPLEVYEEPRKQKSSYKLDEWQQPTEENYNFQQLA